MKLLVTGGAGFIGSHVVEAALVAGHEVAILDYHRTENVPAGVRFFEVDIRNRSRVFGAFGAFEPTHVSHHAAWTDAPGSLTNPREHFENNVLGSINVIDACVGACVERVVFASSGGAIYGETKRVATEETLPRPKNPYGAGKLAVEHLLASACAHSYLTSVSFRYPNVYGPRSSAGVIGIFMRAALRGEELRVFGEHDGGTRSYVFVADVACANLQALSGDSKCSVVNVGSGVYASTGFLARTIKVMTGSSSPIVNGYRAGDVNNSMIAADAFVREYQHHITGMDAGLARTLEWWRSQ